MNRLAIIGGTFNPPHMGHMRVAQTVLDTTEYDTILLVPTNIPAHKSVDESSGPEHRMRMVELLCSLDQRFLSDSCEIERGGVTYSIDTVYYVMERYRFVGKPGFVIGDDLVDGFGAWKEVDTFVRLVDLIVAHREFAEEVGFCYPHRYVDNPVWSVSSREVRRRIREGESISGMLPQVIEDYVRAHDLYVE